MSAGPLFLEAELVTMSLIGQKRTLPVKSRIMYIESKADGLTGPARIGRVTASKSDATLYYQGKAFQSLRGSGFKSNYFDVETGEHYWISGPRRDGRDALYATHIKPEIDADIAEEYWTQIRKLDAQQRG